MSQPTRDHPRVCGEKQHSYYTTMLARGSPPRMRGKAKNRCRSCPLTRITPAYAGKRTAGRNLLFARWDHPRVCGEKCLDGIAHGMIAGSPPRVRGKVRLRNLVEVRFGITPAYAGKSSRQPGAGRWRRDHPRVCGEKTSAMSSSVSRPGSPPRMRGKAYFPVLSWRISGITPAYAGKSSQGCCFLRVLRDHPRVCGEKLRSMFCAGSCRGSPPRMRGKVPLCSPPDSRHRITPAYAGKSSKAVEPQRPGKDHPRVCGEKRPPPWAKPAPRGSPPRMRGKVHFRNL